MTLYIPHTCMYIPSTCDTHTHTYTHTHTRMHTHMHAHTHTVDDGDISFDLEDIIENIEMVDEGWWIGECHGKRGLFPSNYVERM